MQKRTGLMSTSTPLVVAACKGHQILLLASCLSYVMMMIAMKKIMTNFKGHTSVIAALLESPRTKVNRTVSGGWTALMWAAW